MKKLSNDEFFIKWKPVHAKGLMIYLLTEMWASIAGIIISDILFAILKHSIKRETVYFMIQYFLIVLVVLILGNLLKWKSSENRYKYMKNLYDEIEQSRKES